MRRHIERVAAQRRALPIGGKLAKDFELVSEAGPTRLSALFGDKKTLTVYSMMYGPQRKAPCPSCTSFLSAWNGIAVNLRERVAIVVTARSRSCCGHRDGQPAGWPTPPTAGPAGGVVSLEAGKRLAETTRTHRNQCTLALFNP
jgi:predicted dithiol-disulfide oxidoreductase (DUF899 family)